METRQAIDNESAKKFTTEQIRENFLVQNLFVPDKLNLTYTYYDRIIVGGVSPFAQSVVLKVDEKIIGSPYLLERREMGIINIGGTGRITADNEEFELELKDCLYIGRGTKDVTFSTIDKNNPARFYLLSAPAHHTFDTKKISIKESTPVNLGDDESCNKRTIYKYIHPEGVQSCQLVMGITILAPGNVWNTMPAHTHQRRIEVYQYFDVPEDQLVFHFMGEVSQTRHIAVRNNEAVLSPSWSIHSGVGTKNYSFIWGMAGENQTFTDMDAISIDDLK
ncbi:MAG: 5-dehydro-4-deoxy-D-glucuronate isomerase [Chitinispirillia bacterium]